MTTESTNHNLTPPRLGQAEIMLIRDLFCRVDDAYGLIVECQYIVDKKMCHDIVDNAL